MNVHLIKTPECNLDDYNQVLALLRSFPGPIEFLSSVDNFPVDGFSNDQEVAKTRLDFRSEKKKINSNLKNDFFLDWIHLFDLCVNFREHHALPATHFVILLTAQKNQANWFSMFDGKNNAFIDCRDWEYYTEASSAYPIAYEVVANILRTLMNPEFVLPNPYFHENAKGCMNDLCLNKNEISLKLRTADVCQTCINRLNALGIDDRILDQGISILEGIRLQLLFRSGARRPRQLSEIKLTENNKLYFTAYGNLELKLYPLQKVLYAFYLNHLEGVRLNELSDHKVELLYWYRKFSNADTNEEINNRIDDLINPIGSSFSQKKSSLNNKLTVLLGENLAQHYKIAGVSGEPFKINIQSTAVNLPVDSANRYA